MVGKRLRLHRHLLGMKQAEVAARLGLTFQQVQKYENGMNRVSASRLAEMAQVLGVPISLLFADEPLGDIEASTAEPARGRRSSETVELIRHYYAIPDENVRRQFLQLVKAAAGQK